VGYKFVGGRERFGMVRVRFATLTAIFGSATGRFSSLTAGNHSLTGKKNSVTDRFFSSSNSFCVFQSKKSRSQSSSEAASGSTQLIHHASFSNFILSIASFRMTPGRNRIIFFVTALLSTSSAVSLPSPWMVR